MKWVPLHVHSQYSILDSTLSVTAIAQRAKHNGMASVALTDSGNLYGAVDFYNQCLYAEVKPIIGCEMWMAAESRWDKKKSTTGPSAFSITLLAKNKKGYQNLSRLSSLGFIEGFYYVPRIDRELLAAHSEGVICLSGSLRGRVPYLAIHGSEKELLDEIQWYQQLFGEDYYFEMQRHPMTEEVLQADSMESWWEQNHHSYVKEQELLIEKLKHLSQKLGISYVVTNDSHYLDREDWKSHEILLNIQSGEPCEIAERDGQGQVCHRYPNPKRKTYPSHELYFKSVDEMAALFSDLPEGLQTSLTIAEKCTFTFDFETKHYPVFSPPELKEKEVSPEERQQATKAYLLDLCTKAIPLRYTSEILQQVEKKYPDKDPLTIVQERLSYEFEIISSKGMCDYLLIVYDFIDWAKRQNIPLGPGRGSVVGSILSYLIGITDVEPLSFHLFFERFINPERISYPDIDVDICMDRRNEVIRYMVQKYGKDKVAQIITFGTMKAKMAIRDVGRMLSIPLPKVNAIVKLVPDDLQMTLEKALSQSIELKELYEKDEEARSILDQAKKIEGSIRNTSIHAAGLIVCADPITDYIPVCTSKDSEILVTQFAMKPAESVGLLKIDFLGLKTLTALQKALSSTALSSSCGIDWMRFPLRDEKTFQLLNQGKTLGVFQLELGGMHDLAIQLHLDHFEELIAVVALYRPGPMEMIPTFIHRKLGQEATELDHPWLKDILEETYGVMVYQEQVMQIASRLAGYSLGEADVLRRAMGKKDKKEMAKQRQKFIQGAQKNGIEESVATEIFDKMEKFASYGFNKSHAAAYAYICYATAFLKAHYPKEWMAALMTCERDDLTKISSYIQECRSMGVAILPPDVNESEEEFTSTTQGIRFAMAGIKGVGQAVVEAIVAERKRKGPFTSLYSFIQRLGCARVGKKTVELLIDAGAFDFTRWSRESMKEGLEALYSRLSKEQKERDQGILNLFSFEEFQEEYSPSSALPPPSSPQKVPLQVLQREKELLGFYLTEHPLENWKEAIQRFSCISLKEISVLEQDTFCKVAFIIDEIQWKISSKTQKKFAILTISDRGEHYELPLWPDLCEANTALIQEHRLICALVQVDRREGTLRLQCRWLGDLTQMNEAMIDECNRVQQQSARRKMFSKESYPKKDSALSSQSTLLLQLNGDRMVHSKIVELKKLFQSAPGSLPVILQIGIPGKKNVEIHLKRRIDANERIREALKKISFIEEVRWVQK